MRTSTRPTLNRVRASLRAFTLKVSLAPISVECLFSMTLLRGVARRKQMSMRWTLKAAEIGRDRSCWQLAASMYLGHPYAREVGYVEAAAGVATSAGAMEGHDVPADVLTGVVHWLRKGGLDPIDDFRRAAQEGAKHGFNDGCEIVGHSKDFRVCSQCKTARYCGDACQKQDWTTGGHKATCGTFASELGPSRGSVPAQA